jgi:hypothetical protein
MVEEVKEVVSTTGRFAKGNVGKHLLGVGGELQEALSLRWTGHFR